MIMTCINSSEFLTTTDYSEFVEEIFEVEIKSKQIQVIKAELEVQAELKGRL